MKMIPTSMFGVRCSVFDVPFLLKGKTSNIQHRTSNVEVTEAVALRRKEAA